MMLRIGMCDDCSIFLNETQRLIKEYLKAINHSAEIFTYEKGEALLQDLRKEKFQLDLIFLDIDMPSIDGLQVAQKIREQNQKVLLVFLSGIEERVYETFRVYPFRFIRKKTVGMELKECLEGAINYFNENQDLFTFKSQEGTIRLPIGEIMYFYYFNRRLEVYTLNAHYYSVSMVFKEVIEQFNNKGFVCIHRSSMVNVRHIKAINKLYIVLDNNQRLSISRHKYNEVFEAFTNYAR
ncbi:hypothetical protein CS063_03635 [Sporanaerobium hydrogeniformans]|uniref:Uncharacterized protein n=1 Tax=Sporanaerobium hydrogeniformans TaxID=3072179 RepID=A0AC61DET4_9FIRM|nr:LytTR family DNA-binding domain-containing protein [Sporanaerobium hydrogeniformans]PHV71664.1 hypothetical protein CS063_03635 [Sporanaerobium hydrogeniformans]